MNQFGLENAVEKNRIGAERTEDEVACVHTVSRTGMQGCPLNGLKPEHLESSAHREAWKMRSSWKMNGRYFCCYCC